MRLPVVLAAPALAGLFVLGAAPTAQAQTAQPSTDQPLLRTLAAEVDPKALESTIRSLVGFGTRH
ncbi:MAG: peptidase M28, partial [Caulobacter sp.]